MKKRIFLLLLCLALLLTGCAANRRTPKQTFRIYGLSGAPGGDAISAVDVDWSERKSLTVDQQAQAALEQLLGACTEPGYRTPIPQGVTLRSCQLTGGMALVDFSQGYEQLSGIDLTIADYCVTLTLSQLPGISVVRITVEGQDLAYRTHSLLQSREVLMTSEDDVTRTLGVRLFFPARESGLLTSESRTLTLHEGDSAVEAIMSALMEKIIFCDFTTGIVGNILIKCHADSLTYATLCLYTRKVWIDRNSTVHDSLIIKYFNCSCLLIKLYLDHSYHVWRR